MILTLLPRGILCEIVYLEQFSQSSDNNEFSLLIER